MMIFLLILKLQLKFYTEYEQDKSKITNKIYFKFAM